MEYGALINAWSMVRARCANDAGRESIGLVLWDSSMGGNGMSCSSTCISIPVSSDSRLIRLRWCLTRKRSNLDRRHTMVEKRLSSKYGEEVGNVSASEGSDDSNEDGESESDGMESTAEVARDGGGVAEADGRESTLLVIFDFTLITPFTFGDDEHCCMSCCCLLRFAGPPFIRSI